MSFLRNLKKQFHREDPQQLKRECLWLLSRAAQYRGKILAVGLLGLIGTLMNLASSVASKYLIDAVTGYGSDMLVRAAVIMVLMILMACCCISICIEFMQYWFMAGLAETDDVIHNTLGGVAGAIASRIPVRLTLKKRYKGAVK